MSQCAIGQVLNAVVGTIMQASDSLPTSMRTGSRCIPVALRFPDSELTCTAGWYAPIGPLRPVSGRTSGTCEWQLTGGLGSVDTYDPDFMLELTNISSETFANPRHLGV